jgi:hypothetical protein
LLCLLDFFDGFDGFDGFEFLLLVVLGFEVTFGLLVFLVFEFFLDVGFDC